jgi:hypothetical protein
VASPPREPEPTLLSVRTLSYSGLDCFISVVLDLSRTHTKSESFNTSAQFWACTSFEFTIDHVERSQAEQSAAASPFRRSDVHV